MWDRARRLNAFIGVWTYSFDGRIRLCSRSVDNYRGGEEETYYET